MIAADTAPGTLIYFIRNYSESICSGKVVTIKENAVVIDYGGHSEQFVLCNVKDCSTDRRDLALRRGQELYQEAMKKLDDANRYYTEAGVPAKGEQL
jgi:ribosomal protein S1